MNNIKEGYYLNDIKEVLDKVDINKDESLKKYLKELNRLSSKYQGTELKLKLKQKLYSKGYTIEEINKIINVYYN